MSTDFQQARVSLGARLRELRAEGGLTGRELAGRLAWGQSKVSKLENGKQTPTVADLTAWAEGTGNPGATGELIGRLRGLETQYRSWRRQLAGGYRAVQDAHRAQAQRTRFRRSFDPSLIPGLLQTADYARSVLTRYSTLHTAPRDIEAAVRARMGRQDILMDQTRSFHFLVWEGALRARPCRPAVLSAQLDRIVGRLGPGNVRVGIVPFEADMNLPAGVGFSVHDDSLVITETWHAEMWLDGSEDVALHVRAWEALERNALYGAGAHRALMRAKRTVIPRE
ncbi:helix-turn-helix domain-containing protein [Streptomyces halstedii]|uniref:helix-turn-helix domain-containing protein n=1 Tax=Streptomyces TaxID=1883 RepID=UPI00048E5A30|nr:MULTISPECIES: helix-turn-helix transcriptional regulator [Streptomyces]MYR71674.1 helix-turn-helix domain-containing protein [Streptomyces sp. SID4925]MYY14946.1 helix-turn-helix domain-containing protein [Streptomyces sp. SID4912]SCD55227.1 Helix-turn-helix domain-containing protein [Streptomyces sp. DpondAA-D4]